MSQVEQIAEKEERKKAPSGVDRAEKVRLPKPLREMTSTEYLSHLDQARL